MSKSLPILVMSVAFVLSTVFGAGVASAGDEPSEAFAFYLSYLKAAAQAETINDIKTFMPSWWRSRYESSDQEAQAAAVARIRKGSQDLQKVMLEKEESVDDGVRLHMTAQEKNDFPMRGDVLLILESGAFTVEEQKWATSR